MKEREWSRSQERHLLIYPRTLVLLMQHMTPDNFNKVELLKVPYTVISIKRQDLFLFI